MADACLRTRTHYLDITGEVAVFESLATRDAEARAAGVMLLPGAGFDVVPSDCLAAHLRRRLPTATHLALGFAALGLSQLLAEQKLLEARPVNVSPLAPRAPHFAAKAKRVIHIFANGGPSHLDTFDPKPALARYAGKSLPRANLRTERRTGHQRQSRHRGIV